jgi:hypothetical protein
MVEDRPLGGPTVQSALETAVREYRSTREYERDVRARREQGWRVVSVLQRPGHPSVLKAVGVSSGVMRSPMEYLVTYSRVPRPEPPSRPLEWLLHPSVFGLPRVGRRLPVRWLWIVVGLILMALLAYGLIDFFSDALLP